MNTVQPHSPEVLEYAITMLKKHCGMERDDAVLEIQTKHAYCRHSRECPWMPPALITANGTIEYYYTK